MIKTVVSFLSLFVICSLASAQDANKTKLMPLRQPSRDVPSDSILTARKWYIDLSNLKEPEELVLQTRPTNESYIAFKTDHTFVLYINEKDCTSALQGEYRIILTDMEADKRTPTLQAQLFSFTKNKSVPKCAEDLVFFLERLGLESKLYPSQGKILLKKSNEPAVAPAMQ